MARLINAFFFGLLLFTDSCFSGSVPGLFEAEVIVKSQSTEDRNNAIQEALAIVLGKIMAGENILENTAVKIALTNAAHYTTQYQYSLIPSEADGSSNRIMRVQFDQNAVFEIMRSSNLGLWSEERDDVLVWLVINESGKKQIFNEELMPDIAHAVSKAAKQKGLPIIFPLMDLAERQKISVNDILSAYSDRLNEVSERYGTSSMLIGRVDKKKKCWTSEWAFYFNNGVKQWANPCTNLNQAMLSGMQGAYDKLSKYYAVKSEILELGTVILKVSGIKGMTDMSKVTNYLNLLPMVESVNWLKVKSGVNYYKIKTNGSRRSFENAVGLGRVLDPLDAVVNQKNELFYRLLPENL